MRFWQQDHRPKRRSLFREVAKFASIGGINTVVNLAIFNLLLGIGPLKANMVATVVATTSSYFMNRHWTYRHLRKSSLRREYVLFFCLNIIGLFIESAILFVARYGMHFNEHTDVVAFNIAKFGGLGLGTLFRFWSYRRFVFRAGDKPVPGDDLNSADSSLHQSASSTTKASAGEQSR